MIEIIAYDHVVVAGVRIPRPNNVSVQEWEEFWRDADADSYANGYADGYYQGCEDTKPWVS